MALRHGAGFPGGGRGKVVPNAMSLETMQNRSEAQAALRPTSHEANTWVQPFVREHYVQLGAMAWQGFRQWGRGLVTCYVELPYGRPIRWTTETVRHRLDYWSNNEVAFHLDALQLDNIDDGLLHRTLATYEPRQELVVLMLGSVKPVILYLRQMRITPVECDRQLQRRQSEFCGVVR